MPELRPRRLSSTKAQPKEKTPIKRKAAANDDASPIATKKLKEDAKSKKTRRSISSANRKEEQPSPDDETPGSEGDDEAQALAKIVDSDDEPDDATPDEEIKDLHLPIVPQGAKGAPEPDDGEPGVVYIGRIPKGFYEHQMREYFSQFGQVNKIRMSRNKATGQSKHFAFIEFAELGVAEIVAKTMDNYLLAGHILKVKIVPKSQIHEKLWIGANRRFKKIPWNKMAGNRLKKPLSESTWVGKISKEEAKRNERAKKLREIGYEFEAPKLKGVHDENVNTPALEAAKDNAPEALEPAPQADKVDIEEPAPVSKKAAKGDKKSAGKTSKKSKKVKKVVS
ncbi:putative ribosomal biogenesis protein Gar2 [Rosellinia necatrix]|uniref:Putative ribosomal biogenesis protein Gar2 n=1 Tax=Rosellinia necatrix TaxID=77044 RepID=A0A1S7UL82_ROSNE|nr:putative ribosomal biogenesis protein Gar2 [Rosellinia necatrix]